MTDYQGTIREGVNAELGNNNRVIPFRCGSQYRGIEAGLVGNRTPLRIRFSPLILVRHHTVLTTIIE